MYKLVRVEDRLQVVERNSNPEASAFSHQSASDLQGLAPSLWSPCTRVEKQFWKSFLRTGIAEEPYVAKSIIESWQRCLNASVEFEGKCRNLISSKELETRRGLLCEISEPIMETVYQCLRGSRSVVVLVDKEGYILATLGDLESLKQAEKLNFGPGANWSEQSVGTNALGTAMEIGRSLQVTGCEHYCENHHIWTCAATPIRNPEGEIIGCLDISGPREEARSFSLGMTVAAVRAIEERLRLEQSHRYYVNVSKHLAAVFSSVKEALITVDNTGLISGVNASAARLLDLHPKDLIGSPIERIIRTGSRLRDFVRRGREYSDEEFLLNSDKGQVRCVGSAHDICGENGSKLGRVFTFTRVKPTVLPKSSASKGNNLRYTFKDIIGESLPILETLEKAKRVAGSSSTVLLLGESGTGKELFAQAVHSASDRSGGPFISVNCGAIPGELIQSELFGYAEGAFTGARKGGRAGKIELASGGTVFLDEIGDMPLQMQVNLVRVLEEKTIVRIGDSKVIPADVRVIAATNRSLYEEVAKGRFREDLFYRLNVVSIILPPLRERKGDISLLTGYFVDKISKKMGKDIDRIDPEVFAALEACNWPGNVRELANALEYAINLVQGSRLPLSHLPPYLQKNAVVRKPSEHTEIMPLALLEKMAIENALKSLGGNISKAAAALGIGRNTLYDKMKKHRVRV